MSALRGQRGHPQIVWYRKRKLLSTSILKNCAIWLSEKSIADLPPADIVYIRPAGGEDGQLLPDSIHPGEIQVDDGGFLAAAAFMQHRAPGDPDATGSKPLRPLAVVSLHGPS